MKYLSLFSGIGGFELGIKQAYEEIQNNKKIGGQRDAEDLSKRLSSNISSQSNERQHPTCIGYSEIDKYATQIYEKQFKHKNYGDITKINEKELPDFDLIVGGFPCQAFSIAGKRGGFSDTRGTLFFDIARIIREKQPRLLLLENVKGLLSHDKGRTFTTIISTLDELGYDCQWQVLNSKNFGVPQNRERVFIIGHLRGTPRPQVFPFGGDDQKANGKLQELTTGVSDALRIYNVGRVCKGISGQVDSPNGIARTLKGLGGGLGAKTGMYQMEDAKIRRLTPTECERLQGFPDGWTDGVSDTQRYKTLGNAVTVNVIKEIMKRLN